MTQPATQPAQDEKPVPTQVTCTRREHLQNPFTGITHLGTQHEVWSREEIIQAIRSNKRSFYTMSDGGRSEVAIYDGPFGEYLRTKNGASWDDALLALPECSP